MRTTYPHFTMPGYGVRVQDGMFQFIPWQHLSGGGAREHGEVVRGPRHFTVTPNEPLVAPPIQKRTPQQRLSSLSQKWIEDTRKAGGIPGLSDAKVSELVGRSWKRGDPFTAEDVRAAAATMLSEAENKYEASERKKIVRTAPSD